MSQPSAAPRARPSRVQLLVTCLVDSFFPDVGFSVVAVLERLGLQVDVPAGQTCCGQPAFNSGSWDDARAMWHATLKADAATVSYVNLTIWEFKQGGPDQFSLGLQVGGIFHHASTVKGGTIVGSGTATVERAAATSLHAKGADEKGVAFDVTLRCAKVIAAVEEGGR